MPEPDRRNASFGLVRGTGCGRISPWLRETPYDSRVRFTGGGERSIAKLGVNRARMVNRPIPRAKPRAESVLTHRHPARHLPAETAPRSTITQIYEGTNQIQRMVMARQLLK